MSKNLALGIITVAVLLLVGILLLKTNNETKNSNSEQSHINKVEVYSDDSEKELEDELKKIENLDELELSENIE